MVLRGCREATMAPTTEKVSTMAKERTTVSASPTLPYGSPGGVDPLARASAIPPPRSATESTTSDQASQAAERVLVPPTPRPCCSLNPSVTTLLYSSIVFKALRQPLRGSFYERRSAELTKIHLSIGQAMYACIHETGGRFFEGVCAPNNATAIFRDPPYPATRKNRSPITRTPARSESRAELPWTGR
jgi:hypothetical protein